EAGAAPQDPTTTQSDSIEDQGNVTRRPILDKEFARRMEYQDLIIDVVMESGTAARRRHRMHGGRRSLETQIRRSTGRPNRRSGMG
ncbi:20678_t:CDS:2, partial [Gigaspora rosea]